MEAAWFGCRLTTTPRGESAQAQGEAGPQSPAGSGADSLDPSIWISLTTALATRCRAQRNVARAPHNDTKYTGITGKNLSKISLISSQF
jgi:hypothetical protein